VLASPWVFAAGEPKTAGREPPSTAQAQAKELEHHDAIGTLAISLAAQKPARYNFHHTRRCGVVAMKHD